MISHGIFLQFTWNRSPVHINLNLFSSSECSLRLQIILYTISYRNMIVYYHIAYSITYDMSCDKKSRSAYPVQIFKKTDHLRLQYLIQYLTWSDDQWIRPGGWNASWLLASGWVTVTVIPVQIDSVTWTPAAAGLTARPTRTRPVTHAAGRPRARMPPHWQAGGSRHRDGRGAEPWSHGGPRHPVTSLIRWSAKWEITVLRMAQWKSGYEFYASLPVRHPSHNRLGTSEFLE